MGGEENSEIEFMDVAVPDSFDGSVIFRVVIDVIGFILFMHQQIPSVIEDMAQEFAELQSEYADLEAELTSNETKALSRKRNQASRKRYVKMRIRRHEKWIACFSNLKASLHLLLSDVPDIEKVSLVLGPSPLRPLTVYELSFPKGTSASGDLTRSSSKLAESTSRKAIRALISNGAGSDSCPGPTKLFLFVKAPSCFTSPLHFLPKRGLRYNKKVMPLRLRFFCRANDDAEISPRDSIWFQCRHIIKGISFQTIPPED